MTGSYLLSLLYESAGKQTTRGMELYRGSSRVQLLERGDTSVVLRAADVDQGAAACAQAAADGGTAVSCLAALSSATATPSIAGVYT